MKIKINKREYIIDSLVYIENNYIRDINKNIYDISRLNKKQISDLLCAINEAYIDSTWNKKDIKEIDIMVNNENLTKIFEGVSGLLKDGLDKLPTEEDMKNLAKKLEIKLPTEEDMRNLAKSFGATFNYDEEKPEENKTKDNAIVDIDNAIDQAVTAIDSYNACRKNKDDKGKELAQQLLIHHLKKALESAKDLK